MAEIYLSSISKSHANWLSVRQGLIASNIANANTPGFKTQDVKSFEDKQNLFSSMVKTNDAHLSAGIRNVAGVGIGPEKSWETYYSGGNVSLANEAVKSGDVAAAFELNTSVMRSFHRMVLTVFGS